MKNYPKYWLVIEDRLDGTALQYTAPHSMRSGLRVITSVARELDGKVWTHVSVSRPNTNPSWCDLMFVRDQLIGDREGYQVFPTSDKHVNIHPYCLHMWFCEEGPVLPDFTHGGNSI